MTRVWDLASGELERTLVGQRGTITSAWFSADGNRIATGSSTLGARVWDLSNARAGEVAGIDLGAEFGQIIDVDHQGRSSPSSVGRARCSVSARSPSSIWPRDSEWSSTGRAARPLPLRPMGPA